MGRNLSNLFISQSYQFITQISGSELQDGLGNTITGSLLITSSRADNATSASQAVSASYSNVATSASYALVSTSSSFAINASNAVSASTAISSSYALTASFALNAGAAVNTGSLLVTASAVNNIITFTKGDGSTFPVTVATGSTVSSSFASTASLALLNVLTASSTNATITYTKGDGTTFTNVINNVVNATSASFATSASQAVSASQAQTAVSSSFATSASVATSASFATSASQAVSSSFAISASVATSASFATSASQATTASFAQTIASGLSPTFANVTASNVLITGTASVALLYTQTISSSVIYSSGSNQFGDASNDVQTLYGTVDIKNGPVAITGSVNITGSDLTIANGSKLVAHDINAGGANGIEINNNAGNPVALFGAGGSQGATFYGQINGTTFVGTASLATSASQAVSSSYAFNSTSASFAVSSSRAVSASFATSASQAVSSSFATTASFALNVTPTNTGSFLITASAVSNVITFTKGDASTFDVTVNTGSAAPTIFTNPTGSDNAIGYADIFYSNTSPGTPGAVLFVSSSLIFSNNVSASSIRNVAIVGGKNHQAYDIIGDSWVVESSGLFAGQSNKLTFNGSNNAIIGGQSNTLEASGIVNSIIIGGQSHRLYATENSVILGGTGYDARTASHRSAFIGGSGGTFDYLQDSAVIASNNTTFVGGTLNNITVLSSKNISKNAPGTDITSSVVIAAVDGSQSNRNLNKPYTLYSERLQTFNGAEITGSVIITGSLTVSGSVLGNVIGNNTDTYTSSAAVQQIVTLTQAEYNAIGSPDSNTFYVISGSIANATVGSNTFTGNQVFSGSVRGEVKALTISSNTASLDCSTNNFFTLTLVNGVGTQLQPSNIQPGQTINVRITQPATTGSGQMTFPSSIKQVSGSAYTPTQGANAQDIITFISYDTTNLYLSNIKNFV